MKRIQANFNEGDSFVEVMCYSADGSQSRKELTVSDFAAVLTSHTGARYFNLGKLPSGYYDAAFATNDTFKIVLTIPAGRQSTLYFGKPVVVPFPALAFKFNVQGRKLVKTYCFAVGDNEQLYRYPFGNVSTDGVVCWGSNQDVLCGNYTTLFDTQLLPIKFIGSDSNSDYAGLGSHFSKETGCSCISELIKKLSSMEYFDKLFLVPTKRTMFLRDLLGYEDNYS